MLLFNKEVLNFQSSHPPKKKNLGSKLYKLSNLRTCLNICHTVNSSNLERNAIQN